MEKKNYIQPAIEMLEMAATPILAGSDPQLDLVDDTVEKPLSKELGFDIFE